MAMATASGDGDGNAAGEEEDGAGSDSSGNSLGGDTCNGDDGDAGAAGSRGDRNKTITADPTQQATTLAATRITSRKRVMAGDDSED